MMRTILFIGLLAFSFKFMAQGVGSVDKPFRIQVYTGGPSILKSAFRLSSSFQNEVTFNGKSLIGLSADYRILSWLSVGVDASYRYGQLDFTLSDSTNFNYIRDKWGIDVSEIANPFGHYELKFPRFRMMVSGTVHCLKAESESDLYIQIGLGYNHVRPKLYKDEVEIQYFNKIGTFSLPVAYRLSVGYAYHFAGYFGVFGELGIGGPIFSGGLSVRF